MYLVSKAFEILTTVGVVYDSCCISAFNIALIYK